MRMSKMNLLIRKKDNRLSNVKWTECQNEDLIRNCFDKN